MNRNRMRILVTLGIALAFPVGCNKTRTLVGPGPGHHYGQQKSRAFEVYIYADPSNTNKCLLDWSVGTLWRSENQTVTWFSDDSLPYTIDFKKGSQGSPFQNSDQFPVPANGSQPSGPLQPNASGYYDFQVHAGDKNGPICKDLKDDPGYYIR